MRAILLDSVDEFVTQTKAIFDNQPVQTNFISTLAQAVQNGSRKFERCYWFIVKDNNDEVVGAAVRTVPFGYTLSPMPEEAAKIVAHAIAEADDLFPSAFADGSTLMSFYDAYKALSTPGSQRQPIQIPFEKDLMCELAGELQPHTCTESFELRPATAMDFDLVKEWMIEFHNEAGLTLPIEENEKISTTMINAGRLRLLTIPSSSSSDRVVVSLANCQGIVGTDNGTKLGRIGPVYTPPQYRGHGYASAVTHAVSQDILNENAKPVLLTQAHNLTSNHVYQILGYTVVCENLRVVF